MIKPFMNMTGGFLQSCFDLAQIWLLPIAASIEDPGLTIAWIGLDEKCDAIPIQTTTIDAKTATATIFSRLLKNHLDGKG
jgi:hypothetical protein